MNKKHLLGVLIVIAISAFVLYSDLKASNLNQIINLLKSAHLSMGLGAVFLMISSYLFEAAILFTLSGKESKQKLFSFCRVPVIQALFNAITPMSAGGQPSQLAAMMQMGIEAGKATSILLMKFILYQITVFLAYILTVIFGFQMVMHKFAGLAFFIFIGLSIHACSTLFLLSVMFAYNWTKKISAYIFKILAKFMQTEKISRLEEAVFEKIETFYQESRHLKRQKRKLVIASLFTILQLLCFYSIPYLVLLTVNQAANWVDVTQMNIMIMMFMSVIPIPGASGGAEYSFQTLFSTFISSTPVLVFAVFFWRFVTYFLGMLLGIIAWVIKPKKV